MVIFYSYVKLPEGNSHSMSFRNSCNPGASQEYGEYPRLFLVGTASIIARSVDVTRLSVA